MTWGLPNLITLFRLGITLVLLFVFYVIADPLKIWVFLFMASFGGLMDTVDGRVARYFNQVTESGKFLDAAGDRLVKTAIMCMLSFMGVFPWLLTAFHLGVKNQFFELPAFYAEGRLAGIDRIKAQLPLYYHLTYNKSWIGFGVILNHSVWILLIYHHFNRPVFTAGQLMIIYSAFFMHTLVRAIPVVSIYTFIDRGLPDRQEAGDGVRKEIPSDSLRSDTGPAGHYPSM